MRLARVQDVTMFRSKHLDVDVLRGRVKLPGDRLFFNPPCESHWRCYRIYPGGKNAYMVYIWNTEDRD